jgi:hypothetical protein
VTLIVTGPGGSDIEMKTDYITVSPSPTTTWTFILYLAGDNDLEYWLEQGLYKAETAANNPYVQIVALLDGDGNDDTRRYRVRPDGNYTPGVDLWEMGELDMGDPGALVDFVNWARDNYPADHYYLAVSNHGAGTRGIAWEYYRTPGNITRPELETALSSIAPNGASKIDIVHYDACLMAMLEVAYQLKDHADYFIASENLGWSIFAYDRYIAAVGESTTPQELAGEIANEYSEALHGYPHTITALDLSTMDGLGGAVDDLAQTLVDALCDNSNEIHAVWTDSQKLDSRFYLVIDNEDEYIDLYHFAQVLKENTSDEEILSAAQGVLDVIDDPDKDLLVKEHHQSGMYHGNYWDLDNVHGLSIYFPPSNEVWGYLDYVSNEVLPFVNDTQWDEFLEAYFGCVTSHDDPWHEPGVPPMLVHRIYLPLVVRSAVTQ